MQVLRYETEAGAAGEATLSRFSLTQGTAAEVIVLVREAEAEDQEGMRRLSASTMDHWDNPVDDEVWNNA